MPGNAAYTTDYVRGDKRDAGNAGRYDLARAFRVPLQCR